jgi:rare lipoprotein A (peptidoglycan hydrolase)
MRRHSTEFSHFVAVARGTGILLLIALVGFFCPVPGRAHDLQAQKPTRIVFAQTGIASWYGNRHQGRLTANGERFDVRGLTAAHRSLPFGTILRVTNLKTGKVVIVRVNDRGPYIRGRVVDLSAAAGKALGISKAGIVQVRIEAFSSSESRSQLNTSALRGRPSNRAGQTANLPTTGMVTAARPDSWD